MRPISGSPRLCIHTHPPNHLITLNLPRAREGRLKSRVAGQAGVDPMKAPACPAVGGDKPPGRPRADEGADVFLEAGSGGAALRTRLCTVLPLRLQAAIARAGGHGRIP